MTRDLKKIKHCHVQGCFGYSKHLTKANFIKDGNTENQIV